MHFWRKGKALQGIFGPELCKPIRSVTPLHVTRLSPLLTLFIDMGLKNGVLSGTKLEVALKTYCVENVAVIGSSSAVGCDLLCHEGAEHCRWCFSMVRVYKQESDSPLATHGSRPRRYPKTSHFRRLASASELIVINALAGKMVLDTHSCFDPFITLAARTCGFEFDFVCRGLAGATI